MIRICVKVVKKTSDIFYKIKIKERMRKIVLWTQSFKGIREEKNRNKSQYYLNVVELRR